MQTKSKEFSWIWIASLAVLGFLLGPVAMQASAATVATQYPDYAPGQTVVISGSGWQPGETVAIMLHEDPTMCPNRQLTAMADANGDIRDDEFVVDQHDIGVTFTVMATGLSSGLTAQTTFTDRCPGGFEPDADCPATDLSRCIVGCSQMNQGERVCHPDTPAGTGIAPALAGTVCRNGAGECDVEETCDGMTAACPDDAKQPAGTSCTDDTNPCTLDQCDGTNVTCQHPAGNAGAVCRAAAGECDVEETCDGSSTTCPDDAKQLAGTACTADTNPCTLDQCDGTNVTCQHPAGNAGTVCRVAAGACDVAESCTGSSTTCPSDVFKASGTVCRPTAGVCDLAESCTGSSAACPYDRFKSSSTVCRPSAGVCDMAESCSGSSAACPTDMILPRGTVCPTDSNPCTDDICDGVHTACQHPITTCSLVTNSSLCTFDVDTKTDGSQFRLILTPDQSPSVYKLNASNPGQFYYNIIYLGPGNTTVTITLPYPFVTQGAVPIHVYSEVTTAAGGGFTCFGPGAEVAHSSTQITLGTYATQQIGPTNTTTVPVTLPSLPGGVAYINIHLDYGLKGTTNYSKDAMNGVIDYTTAAVIIADKQSYVFDDSSTPGNSTVQSENAFKRDPGIGGLVKLSGTSDPVPNVKVQIYDSSNTLLATVYTDQDGWYMWQYKYTGKAATFTVNLPVYNLAQAVTLKSNGFLVVNVTLP